MPTQTVVTMLAIATAAIILCYTTTTVNGEHGLLGVNGSGLLHVENLVNLANGSAIDFVQTLLFRGQPAYNSSSSTFVVVNSALKNFMFSHPINNIDLWVCLALAVFIVLFGVICGFVIYVVHFKK